MPEHRRGVLTLYQPATSPCKVLSRPHRLVSAASALILAALVPGCAINPVTGEREFVLISEGQEIRMGSRSSRIRTSFSL